MLVIEYLYIVLSNPLSRFPQGGKVGRHTTPSPLPTGRQAWGKVGKGVIIIKELFNYLLLPIVIKLII